MSLVIQIENFTPNTVVIPFPGASPLLLVGTQTGEGERVALTAAQFKQAEYDLEGFSVGTHGVEKSLRLWARDPKSGEEVQLTFAQAKIAIDKRLSADETAKAEQLEQASKAHARVNARIAEAEKAKAEALASGGMAGEVAQALDGIGALGAKVPAAEQKIEPLDLTPVANPAAPTPPAGVVPFVPPTHKI